MPAWTFSSAEPEETGPSLHSMAKMGKCFVRLSDIIKIAGQSHFRIERP